MTRKNLREELDYNGHMNWKTGILISIGVLVAALLAGWQLTPRVEEVTPPSGEIQGNQPLGIRFSRAMDPGSVEESLEILPPYDGEINWDTDFKTITFTPKNIWPSGEIVSIRLNRGARSKFKLPFWGGFSTEWPVSPTSLVYLWPADGSSNLYQINPDSGESWALIDLPGGILDYSISPDHEKIYYSAVGERGASRIMELDLSSGESSLLIDCAESLCTSPSLSSEGGRLAYEVISREPKALPGIRIYNLRDGTEQDLGNPDEYLENPLWAPSGWLVYYNQTIKGYQFWNPLTEMTRFLANETGGDGSWSADGRYFLTSEILFVGDTLAPRHLQIYDLVEETTQDLSEGGFLEDLNPSFSTQGLNFAFSRKYLNPGDWTPGRQLWVMDLEGGETKPLTDEVDYQHTSFSWHPDGEQLAYVRYNQASLADAPEIWVINTTSGEALRLIINGFSPGWIP